MSKKARMACETEKDTFPMRLREAMKKRETNQTHLVARIKSEFGVSMQRQSLSQYMNGQTKPDTEKLAVIARALGVSADYLLGLTNFDSSDIELAKFQEQYGLSNRACEELETFADLASDYDGDIFKQTDFVNELIAAAGYPAMLFCDAIDSYLHAKLADVTSRRYGIAEDNENVVISAHEYALLSKERAKSMLAGFVEHLWNKLCEEHDVRPNLTYNYETHHKMVMERQQEWEREHADELKD